MAKRIRRRKTRRKEIAAKRPNNTRALKQRPRRRSFTSPAHKRRRLVISDARLARGLRVLSETKDIKAAARAIHVSVDRFKDAARRKRAIRKLTDRWTLAKRLPRRMPIFAGNRQIAISVRSRAASLIGRYMAAVRNFLRTNDPKFLVDFKDVSVRDVRGKPHKFQTDPNVLYRLSSAGGEPFEEMYRIRI